MGNTQRKPATIQELTNACVRPRIPFMNASPPEKLWNHDPNDVNQVYQDIFISGGEFAKNLDGIQRRKISHILNTAEGKSFMHVDTGPDFYPSDITYMGVRANDSLSYDLSTHFDECSDFIENALNNEGRVLVHCRQGYSRSPTIVAAYLIQKKGMTAKKALETIRSKREIFPNEGFMKSLIELETVLFFPPDPPESAEECGEAGKCPTITVDHCAKYDTNIDSCNYSDSNSNEKVEQMNSNSHCNNNFENDKQQSVICEGQSAIGDHP